MRQTRAFIEGNEPLLPGTGILWLRAPDVARAAAPGQFLLARCSDGYDPLLRRPLSVHRIKPGTGAEGSIAVLYSQSGAGTAYLRTRRPGDELDIIGPLGKGFTVHRSSRNLLLVGSGWGLSPLVALADQQTAAGRNVVLLAGAATAAQLYPPALLAPEVELAVATEDGSAGRRGTVLDLVEEYWSWADESYACGSAAMYGSLAALTAGMWPRKPVQVLAEMPMACGVGACYACTMETRKGPRLACKDGPRVLLSDLVF